MLRAAALSPAVLAGISMLVIQPQFRAIGQARQITPAVTPPGFPARSAIVDAPETALTTFEPAFRANLWKYARFLIPSPGSVWLFRHGAPNRRGFGWIHLIRHFLLEVQSVASNPSG